MKGLWVQKAPGYSKRQFGFLSGKKMTALLTGIKLQIFKRKKGKCVSDALDPLTPEHYPCGIWCLMYCQCIEVLGILSGRNVVSPDPTTTREVPDGRQNSWSILLPAYFLKTFHTGILVLILLLPKSQLSLLFWMAAANFTWTISSRTHCPQLCGLRTSEGDWNLS